MSLDAASKRRALASDSMEAATVVRMLVVDDVAHNRDLLQRRLRRLGYNHVDTANDGIEAMEALQTKPYDLLLLDIMMPRKDGFSVLEDVRADPRLHELPVIILSALSDNDAIIRGLNLGADDYLTKPFNKVLLQARVKSCLRKRRLEHMRKDYIRKLERFNDDLESQVMEATVELRQKGDLLQRRVTEVTALNEVMVGLAASVALREVTRKVMDLSKKVMRAEASSMLLLNDADQRLYFAVATGDARGGLSTMSVPLGQGIAGWVADNGEALLISDAYADPRFDRSYDQKTGFVTRSLLTVPLKQANKVLGVVQVINPHDREAFDAQDQVLFEAFAGIAAVSVQNARMFEEQKDLTTKLRETLEAERRLSIANTKMGHFLPRHVVDEIARDREKTLALGGRTVEATIMFSDVVGFTRLSEDLDPHRVVAFLNEYMSAMATIIEADNGGMIDKFIGDGIMAIFLPNEEHPQPPAIRAVRAGLQMQARIEALRVGWRTSRPELAEVNARVGIHTGEVVAGNIGSEFRMDYTVIGDNVNVASRIESNGEGGSVLISDCTFALVQQHITAEELNALHVKNRAQPVQVYRVLSISDPVPGG